MSKAIAGQQYTVISGDTLTGIAKQAYGDGSKWRLIWKANSTTLRSNDPNLIYPGEIINIPPSTLEKEIAEETGSDGDIVISGKEKDDFTVIIDGKEIPVEAGRVIRTMDTCADGWTASLQWDPDDVDLYEVLRPGKYPKASVYLGGILVVDGLLYGVKTILSTDNQTVELTGWSYTADIVDTSIKPPYEQNKITLKDRAVELIEPLGIGVVFNADDADEQFERVTCEPEDKIFDHLAELATQRKVLISSTRQGDVLFCRANTNTKPVGSIEEGLPPYQTLEVDFDGRKRYNTYTVIGQSPQKRGRKGKDKKLVAIAKDNTVPRSRFVTYSVGESTVGNIQDTANWHRSKQISEALTLPLQVDTWYAPNNKLWEENTIISVVSKAMYVPNGFDFLIRSVEYIFSAEGTTATLNLIPPQAYTGENIIEPWSK